jgi:hypothetical protein
VSNAVPPNAALETAVQEKSNEEALIFNFKLQTSNFKLQTNDKNISLIYKPTPTWINKCKSESIPED